METAVPHYLPSRFYVTVECMEATQVHVGREGQRHGKEDKILRSCTSSAGTRPAVSEERRRVKLLQPDLTAMPFFLYDQAGQ